MRLMVPLRSHQCEQSMYIAYEQSLSTCCTGDDWGGLGGAPPQWPLPRTLMAKKQNIRYRITEYLRNCYMEGFDQIEIKTPYEFSASGNLVPNI